MLFCKETGKRPASKPSDCVTSAMYPVDSIPSDSTQSYQFKLIQSTDGRPANVLQIWKSRIYKNLQDHLITGHNSISDFLGERSICLTFVELSNLEFSTYKFLEEISKTSKRLTAFSATYSQIVLWERKTRENTDFNENCIISSNATRHFCIRRTVRCELLACQWKRWKLNGSTAPVQSRKLQCSGSNLDT